MTNTQAALIEALEAAGYEALAGKGGYWVRGHGHVTAAQARRLPGVTAPAPTPRPRRERTQPWGDFATIAALNRGLRK